jgi:hypothetical protein
VTEKGGDDTCDFFGFYLTNRGKSGKSNTLLAMSAVLCPRAEHRFPADGKSDVQAHEINSGKTGQTGD